MNVEKLMEKLKRVEQLHRLATTPGEKEAAARAICRLVSKILQIQSARKEVRDFVFPVFG